MKPKYKRSFIIFFSLLILIAVLGVYTNFNDKAEEASVIVSGKMLIPGGQSIGIKMDVGGVLVVGMENIEDDLGKVVNPCKEGGLQIGDRILKIEGESVNCPQDVEKVVNENKDNLLVEVQRKNRTMAFTVKPVYSASEKKYKLGIWVKDKAAGVGTLTYFDPDNYTFGALGHPIVDSRTGTVLEVEEGELVNSRVLSVDEGKEGEPGAIQGILLNADNPIGQLYENTEFGIFGMAYSKITNSLYKEPIYIAGKDEVKKGKAYILTTLENNEVKKYKIKIEKINSQSKAGTKSMVIKVTDRDLLEECGGIVQGMSGSPIIQENKIVGAVTHVFVDDPTRGYGVYIEWMLNNSVNY